MTWTYRTDAVHCDEQYETQEAAIAAAVESGDWPVPESTDEAVVLHNGGWLCLYDDGVPASVRGTMP